MTLKTLSFDDLKTAIEKLYEIPRIASFLLSHDGSEIIFSMNSSGIFQLYRYKLGEPITKIEQLTFAEDGVLRGYDLSTDKKLAFPRDRGGSENYDIYLLNLRDGEKEPVKMTEKPIGRIHLSWFPNNSNLLIFGNDDENNFVKRMNIETNSIETLFTSDRWLSATVSKTGKLVGVSVGRGEHMENFDIIIFPVDNPDDQRIISLSDKSEESTPVWAKNDKRIAFTTDKDDKPRLIIWNIENWEQEYTIDLPNEASSVEWIETKENKDNNELLVVIEHHGELKLFKYHLGDENLTEFNAFNGSIHDVDSKAGKVAFSASSLATPPFIKILDYPSMDVIVPQLPESKLPKNLPIATDPQSVWYESFDGRKIQAWMLNTEPIGERPVIIYVHGGPTASTLNIWNVYLQSLALAGFTIFAPNYRGSTGFGPEFRKLNIGDLGGGDLKDIIYGVKWLQQNGFTKKYKPAIYGGSYGGYMTLFAMTKEPDYWSCGVGEVPVADWIADYELADAAFRHFDHYYFGGPPEGEIRKLYIERSPITYIENLKRPLYILHGRNDSRCPIEPVEKFVEKAKELKLPVELKVTEDEGHGALKTANAVRDRLLVARFFRRQFNIDS